jgi:hypothetical protein
MHLVIFYVSGAISCLVVTATKCDSCREALIFPVQLPPLYADDRLDLDVSSSHFLDSIEVCTSAVNSLPARLRTNTSYCRLKNKVLADQQTKSGVLQIYGAIPAPNVWHNHVHHGYHLQCHVDLFRRFYCCVAKNFVKHIASEVSQQTGSPGMKGKIVKLSSSSLQKNRAI